MSDTYKTKCPNCNAVYKVGIKQLASGYKQARCKRCKQHFVMRENLVTESLITQNKAQSAPQNNHSQSNDAALSTTTIKPNYDTGLIYDDMETNQSDEVTDFKDLQNEWSEETVIQEALKSKKQKVGFYEDENTDDESWLGNLLKDNQGVIDTDDSAYHTRAAQNYDVDEDDESLNDLLNELGVDTADTSTPDHEQSIQRMQERLQSKSIGTSTRNKKSVTVIIIWLFGCLLLILLLPLQYILFNLDSLAKDPTHRPKLERLCDTGICTIPGTDLSKFAVPKQTFRANPNNANQADIIATLVNTDTDAQLYPTLQVNIYNQTGLIGDFIAEPKDYLTVPQRLMSGNKIELFMLSVDIPAQSIDHVEITPMY